MPTPTLLDDLTSLFRTLGWPLQEGGRTSDLFTAFVELLDELEGEGQELVLTITRDFLRHTLEAYDNSVSRLADVLEDQLLPSGASILVFPLIPAGSEGEIKSQGMATLLLKKELRARGPSRNWTVDGKDRAFELQAQFPHRGETYILLVDDFIGSGSTAEGGWKNYKRYAKDTDIPVAACFVAQKAAIEALAQMGIPVFTVHERWKGITDSQHIADKALASAIMDDIENELSIDPNKRHGYLRSEALVMMQSCPDNTFPVYWARRRRSGTMWPRPFRHYE